MVSSLGNPTQLTLENTKETAMGVGDTHRALTGHAGRDSMLWSAQDCKRHWYVQDPPHLGSSAGADHYTAPESIFPGPVGLVSQ